MARTPEDKIAKAQALLDAGNSQRYVAGEVGIDLTQVNRIATGQIEVPAPEAQREKNSLDARLSAAIDLFLDKAVELAHLGKLSEGLKGALGMAVFIDKRNLLRGLPTERTEDMGRTSQAELDNALRDNPELAKRLKGIIYAPKEEQH